MVICYKMVGETQLMAQLRVNLFEVPHAMVLLRELEMQGRKVQLLGLNLIFLFLKNDSFCFLFFDFFLLFTELS